LELVEIVVLVAGFAFTVIIQTAGVISYLLKTTNTGDEKLHKRIDDVKDNYVKRTDLDRDLAAINQTLNLMREDMKNGIEKIQVCQKEHSDSINKRFDLMAGNLLRAVKDKKD